MRWAIIKGYLITSVWALTFVRDTVVLTMDSKKRGLSSPKPSPLPLTLDQSVGIVYSSLPRSIRETWWKKGGVGGTSLIRQSPVEAQNKYYTFYTSNLLHPNTRMYIFHTILNKFALALTRIICLMIKTLISGWLFSLYLIQWWYCYEG